MPGGTFTHNPTLKFEPPPSQDDEEEHPVCTDKWFDSPQFFEFQNLVAPPVAHCQFLNFFRIIIQKGSVYISFWDCDGLFSRESMSCKFAKGLKFLYDPGFALQPPVCWPCRVVGFKSNQHLVSGLSSGLWLRRRGGRWRVLTQVPEAHCFYRYRNHCFFSPCQNSSLIFSLRYEGVFLSHMFACWP